MRTSTAAALVAALIVGLVAIVGIVGASPAAAETPAGDTESRVTSVEPDTGAVDIAVLGGDETLRIAVVPGHEVAVLGYAGEPYLRIDPSGTVYENRRSPAVAANADRYNQAASDATVGSSTSTDAGSEPDWHQVGSGGTATWHDHRTHWMVESVPAPGEPGERVFEWTVDLVVDATPVVVTGELRRGDATTAWPFLIGVVAVAAGLVLTGRRRADREVPVVLACAWTATTLAVALTIAEGIALECWTCRPVDLIPVLVAAVAVTATLVVGRDGRRVAAGAFALVALSGWLLVHVRVLTQPVVVSALAPMVARVAVAGALGAAAAGLVLAALWGRRALDEYASLPPAQRRRRRATGSRRSDR